MKLLALLLSCAAAAAAAEADLVLHNGKVVTANSNFSVVQAISIKDGRILHAGANDEALRDRAANTKVIDLHGRMVLPGLMDSHTHTADAAMTEFDHPIPDMETIADVLAYIRERARVVPAGEWIEVRQVFITRLREQRYPTRAELDEAAPEHPAIFSTGPDASLNTRALKLSGIDRNFKVTDGGSGFAEKDAAGEPTGILRNATRYVKVKSTRRSASAEERVARLKELLADYNSVGITSVCDRNASPGSIQTYQRLREASGLTVRINLSHSTANIGPIAEIEASIRNVAEQPLFKNPHDDLRIIGVKTFLDGGMLTGSAYMREPWGVSEIYSITDRNYRGVRFIPHDRLLAMIRAAHSVGLQFTAHSVGDGAVHALLDAYNEISNGTPLPKGLASISHCNFMSREAVEMAARLGVVIDIQPAWLRSDGRTLHKQFGDTRLRHFQPLRSLIEKDVAVGGGSDHMQKIGSFRSINFYNPFLAMATAVTRRAKDLEGRISADEAISREQMIRFYTINNARVLRCEDHLGSIEPGKLADLIVIDTDLLMCGEEAIAKTQVVQTYLAGKQVYAR